MGWAGECSLKFRELEGIYFDHLDIKFQSEYEKKREHGLPFFTASSKVVRGGGRGVFLGRFFHIHYNVYSFIF